MSCTSDLNAAKPVYLHRILNAGSNNRKDIHYTRQLTFKNKEGTLNLKLKLDRGSAKSKIKYVSEASYKDGGKTHLLAQGFCSSAVARWEHPLTTSLLSKAIGKEIDWVSEGSQAQSNETHYILRSTLWGGHAESQLISDVEDAFLKNSDTVVKLFTPPSYNKDNIYVGGLEIFGPYDMCDAYNNKGNNKYNCVGKLQNFREKHQLNGQEGQRSISQAILDKLNKRFKGEEKNLFTVIYHSQQPYSNVDTYYVHHKEDKLFYLLAYGYTSGFYVYPKYSSKFNDSYFLSQRENQQIQLTHLYGYIHCLANKNIPYNEKSLSFSLSKEK